jgi:hypothetical protein
MAYFAPPVRPPLHVRSIFFGLVRRTRNSVEYLYSFLNLYL